MKEKDASVSRRSFLGKAAAVSAAGLNIIPSRLLGQNSPSNTLNVAFIGSGGRGFQNIEGVAATQQRIHSLCDVDWMFCKQATNAYPDAKFFTDYNEMLSAMGDSIDAVVVSTPDHTHAVATMAAMRLDKHVYVEKPLTHTISESRILRAEAKKRGLCTQMGNTGHAKDNTRLINEYVRSGSLGDIKRVACRTNRPIWPQDIVRPAAAEAPDNLDWSRWIGPVEMKPYVVYQKQKRNDKGIAYYLPKPIAPFNWRGYLDYGTGALGDMGAHILDHPIWALNLGLPSKVRVEKADRFTRGSGNYSHPHSCQIHYYFEGENPIELIWYDGKYEIPRFKGMAPNRKPPKNGCVYYGSKQIMMHNSHGGTPIMIGSERDKFVAPPKTEARSPGHFQEWVDAIKANKPSMAKSNFEVAAPLTETLLLGVIVSNLDLGTELTWDAETMTTGNKVADYMVQHHYRNGVEL